MTLLENQGRSGEFKKQIIANIDPELQTTNIKWLFHFG